MQVRRASADDLDLLTEMRLAFLAEVRALDPDRLPPGLAPMTRSFLSAALDRGALHSWMADDEARPVGVVSLLVLDVPPRPDDLRTREGYVVNMWVDPRARRRGIGWVLLRECLASAEELELRRVFLKATDDGRPLYRRAGFAPNDDWLELHVPPPS